MEGEAASVKLEGSTMSWQQYTRPNDWSAAAFSMYDAVSAKTSRVLGDSHPKLKAAVLAALVAITVPSAAFLLFSILSLVAGFVMVVSAAAAGAIALYLWVAFVVLSASVCMAGNAFAAYKCWQFARGLLSGAASFINDQTQPLSGEKHQF